MTLTVETICRRRTPSKHLRRQLPVALPGQQTAPRASKHKLARANAEWALALARDGPQSAERLGAHMGKQHLLLHSPLQCSPKHSRDSSFFIRWRQGAARTRAFHEQCDGGCTLPTAWRGGWASRTRSTGNKC